MPDRINNQTFRAQVGKHTFECTFQEGHLSVNGEPVSYSFEPVTDGYYALLLHDRSLQVVIETAPHAPFYVTIGDQRKEVQIKNQTELLLERYGLASDVAETLHELRAPMPGLVLSVLVEAGASVATGDSLLVLEAMKMENELRAPGPGVIKTLHVTPGDAVGKNALLLEFER